MKGLDSGFLGDKIREVRERKGVTLRTLAEQAGVSESLVSQIERGKVSPSLDTLLALVSSLDLDLDWLFRDLKRTKAVSLVRKSERKITRLSGVEYQHLSVMKDDSEEHAVEAYYLTLEPGSETGDPNYGHSGRELGVVLEGRASLVYGTSEYIIEAGDSVSFSSDIPHKLRNTGAGRLIALWMTSPPKRR